MFYIFETNEFIIFPKDWKEKIESLEDFKEDPRWTFPFFECFYKKESQIFILLKKEQNIPFNLDNLHKIIPKEFNFFELLVGLLFSNELKIELIHILKKKNGKYKIFKTFLLNSDIEILENQFRLLFRSDIHIEKLKFYLNKGFSTLRDKSEGFIQNYYFCFKSYLKGKNEIYQPHQILNLWASLEVLSVIYLRKFRNNQIEMFTKNQFKNFKQAIKCLMNKISRNKLICLEEFKDNFPQKVVDKINNYVSIRAQAFLLTNNLLEPPLNDLQLPESQSLTIKKIIDTFYKWRNAFVHEGTLPELNVDYFKYYKSFCLILERLLFVMLNFSEIKFYRTENFYQRIAVAFDIPEKYGLEPEQEDYKEPMILKKSYFDKLYHYNKKFYLEREDLFYFVDEFTIKDDHIKSKFEYPSKMVLLNEDFGINENIEMKLLNSSHQIFEIYPPKSEVFQKLRRIQELEKVCKIEKSEDEIKTFSFKGFIESVNWSHWSNEPILIRFFIFPIFIEFH